METEHYIKSEEDTWYDNEEDNFENNPWSVGDPSHFLKYCCPECDYQILNFDMFSSHAVQNHEKSKVLFGTENYEVKNEVDIEIKPDIDDVPVHSDDMEINSYSKKVKKKSKNVKKKLKKIKEVKKEVPDKKEGPGSTFKPRCAICNAKFFKWTLLNEHMFDVHKERIEKTEQCDMCSLICFSLEMLKRHKYYKHRKVKKTKNANDLTSCDLCGLKDLTERLLKDHMNEKHRLGPKQKKFCPYCDFKTNQSWQQLKYHVDFHHPKIG